MIGLMQDFPLIIPRLLFHSEPGQVAGTLAWNGYRHMELYYALPGLQCQYHTINPRLSAEQSDDYHRKDFDENTAAGICYTSGTTGNPKGVVYSHRSLVLQALSSAIGLEVSSRDSILPIVPRLSKMVREFAAA